MKKIFFTSDTHFGSDEILIRDNRPFKNYKDFQKKIITIWNKQAKKGDVIYHLGDFIDFVFNKESDWKNGLNLVKKIKAQVVLIIGNNEQRLISRIFKNNFDSFREYCLSLGFKDVKLNDKIEINGKRFFLTHEPKDYKERYINLFGHNHRVTGFWKPFGINVSCDLNHFKLYDMIEIDKIFYSKNKYWDKGYNVWFLGKFPNWFKKIKNFRDVFIAQNVFEGKFIGFYTREFYCLDNFSAFSFVYDNIRFATVEHAYQAYKFITTAPDIAKQIIASNSPHDAKMIADAHKDKVDANWDNIKVDLMEKLLRAKMEQNPSIKDKLLESANYTLCEDSEKDSFWGIGKNHTGKNMLGKLWMKLRDELAEGNSGEKD